MSLMMRWAAELVTKYQTGKDGKTSHERIRGRACNKPLAIFGEKVLYLPLKSVETKATKDEPKMKYGICLGIIDRTEEVLIGTERGVVKCRTVKRLPENQKWDAELVSKMQGVVWQL